MQRRRPIPVQSLHLRNDQIPLGEERPDLQLVRLGALPLDATGKVYGGELEDGELRGGDVNAPAAGLDLGDAADDEVAYLGGVAGAEGPDGEELVGFCYGAGDGGGDVCCLRGDVGTVASVGVLVEPRWFWGKRGGGREGERRRAYRIH